jgi:hypothetical protein
MGFFLEHLSRAAGQDGISGVEGRIANPSVRKVAAF